MTNALQKTLRMLLASGVYRWDVREPTPLLPGGAWLERLLLSGTVLDLMAPTYVHPLELLTAAVGRFGDKATRLEYEQLLPARLRFRDLCVMVSQGLGLKRPGVAARWFWMFTPFDAGPVPTEMVGLFYDTHKRACDLWADLGVPGDFAAVCRAIPDSGTYARPDFWTQEVNW